VIHAKAGVPRGCCLLSSHPARHPNLTTTLNQAVQVVQVEIVLPVDRGENENK